jgi:hypothetical protein
MRTCERCDGEVSWTSDIIVLAVGVKAHLCVACIRECDRFTTTHALADRFAQLRARESHYQSLAAAGQPVAEADWLALERDSAALRVEFRPVVEGFLVRPKCRKAKTVANVTD